MSARPTSTRRPLPRLRRSIGSSAQVGEPEQLEHLVAAWRPRQDAGAHPGRAGLQKRLRRPGGRGRRSAGARGRWSRRTVRSVGRCVRCPCGRVGERGGGVTSWPGEVHAAGCWCAGTPSRQLNRVVLPAPLGPINPTRSPSSTSMSSVIEGDDPGEPLDEPRAGTALVLMTPSPRPVPVSWLKWGRVGGVVSLVVWCGGVRARGRRSVLLAWLRSGLRGGGRTGSCPTRTARTATSGEIGNTTKGCDPGITQDPPQERALQDQRVEQVEGGAGVDRAFDGAGAQGDDEDHPEQCCERGEVGCRSLRSLLLDGQHRPTQAGDERRDREPHEEPGSARRDADRLGGHLTTA